MDTIGAVIGVAIVIVGNLALYGTIFYFINKAWKKSKNRRAQNNTDAHGNIHKGKVSRKQREDGHLVDDSLRRITAVNKRVGLLHSTDPVDKQAVAHIVHGSVALSQKFDMDMQNVYSTVDAYRNGNADANDVHLAANLAEGTWNNLYHQDNNYTENRYSEF